MQRHLLLTVRGSDERLSLSTVDLDQVSMVHLSDFSSKKAAILQGLGYGWLPEALIARELKKKTLKEIRWKNASEHIYHPCVYHRGERTLGKAARYFLSEVIDVLGKQCKEH